MKAVKVTTYACKAATVTAFGGRCRNVAQEDGFCHNPHQPGSALCESPKVILLHLWMSNNRLHNEVRAAGFYIRDRSIIYTQQKHEMESLLLQRSFETYRPLGDTGVCIFGKKSPLGKVVRVDSLVRELVGAGFSVDGVPHGEDATDGGKVGIRLVVKFRHRDLDRDAYPPQPGAMDDVQRRFYWKLLGACWVKVDVWDNVPKYYVQHEGYTFQFQLAREVSEGAPILVHTLQPRSETLMEMNPAVFKRAVRFCTSTVNCRIPFRYDAVEDDMTELSYNNGYWATQSAR